MPASESTDLRVFVSKHADILFFILLNQLFKNSDVSIKVAVNFFPIMLLSSGSILTILLSGGWFIFIFLYFLFQKEINLSNEK